MKRFLSLLFTALFLTTAVIAEEQADDYDDGFVYDQNGAGDQFIKFDFSASIPIFSTDPASQLFHKDQLNTGVSFDLGYYRFVKDWLGFGGEICFTSNWSIGEKLLTVIPVTAGVFFQPAIQNFEFPIIIGLGLAYESWANFRYFPGLVVKGSAGAYYRITESWSAGISGTCMWLPQWSKGYPMTSGMLFSASIGGRFHF